VISEILAFVFVLGLLIFVHELGHFAVAKWCRIRVERFSLGFPPKMVGFTRGDTEYCISWIPLGGYVKMSGEQPDESDLQGRPYEFMSKPAWQRALVIFAGPAMNYVLAFLVLAGIYFFQGEPVIDQTRAILGTVLEDSPAERAGLMSEDILIAVDDRTVAGFRDVAEIISAKPAEEIKLTWLRGGDTSQATTITRADSTLNLQGELVVVGRIGVSVHHTYQPMAIGAAIKNGFAMTNYYAGMIFTFLRDVITGSVSSKLIGGPLFIAQAAGQAAREGFVSILLLATVLSVNLAVINLAPIPVLDGGQLVFLIIEKIKGSPVSLRARAITQQVGLLCLIALIIFVTKNDIWRIQPFGW